MLKTIAILGYPGAGKSWAVSGLIEYLTTLQPFKKESKKIGLVEYEMVGKFAIMGKYDGSTFQGTDRLSMAVSVDFDKFFQKMVDGFSSGSKHTPGPEYIIAEGDRINNMTFFQAALKHGSLERIKCDPGSYEKLLKQRSQRNHSFSQSFLKTVASKVDKHNFDQVLTSTDLLTYLTTL